MYAFIYVYIYIYINVCRELRVVGAAVVVALCIGAYIIHTHIYMNIYMYV